MINPGEKMANKDFLSVIKNKRSQKKEEKFKGTFLDYLNLLSENPGIVKLAHKRLYESIEKKGVRIIDVDSPEYRPVFNGDKLRVYDYFASEFYGMESVINKLLRFLKSAAHKGEESRQVLLLMGPVGAGKSALIDAVKRALEDADNHYHLEGCPVREEPLHLLPRGLRAEFEEMLGIHIEGDLCPICRHRLMEEFDGEYERFPVSVSSFSQRGRRGIAVVPPMDANSQDVSVLIGTEDISKLDKYSEDDPRVLSLNGAFNVGNRGIVEFVEVFKNEIEFLHTMLTATQEKRVPSPGKNDMIYFDGVILSHCNESEWNRFKGEHTNEAILDRVLKIEVPYVLELDQEQKIYEKMIRRSDFSGAHISPHTLKIAAMFSVMSRLTPSNKCDLLTKMKIYNGDKIIEKGRVKKVDIRDLKAESAEEGMDGVSTRFIMKALDAALSDSDTNMITPINVMDSLIKQISEQIVDKDTKTRYLEIVQNTIREEYLKILENEIAKAFVTAYDEQAQSLFDSYMDNAEAFTTKSKFKNKITREESEPDERFMRSIEEMIGVVGTARDGFRSDVTAFMFSKLRKGEKVNYQSYGPLKEAVQQYLINSVKDIARIVTRSKSRDDEQKKKYSDMVKTLIEEYNYNEHSAEEILTYASNNLWRDS
jgi:serine protein kinase